MKLLLYLSMVVTGSDDSKLHILPSPLILDNLGDKFPKEAHHNKSPIIASWMVYTEKPRAF